MVNGEGERERPYRSPTDADRQATVSRLHTVRFSYAQLLMLLVALSPVLAWLVNEHYTNKHYHEAQDYINARTEQRLSNLEEHYNTMMEQHAKIIGRLDIIASNQAIVLETLAGIRKQGVGIRKALEDMP